MNLTHDTCSTNICSPAPSLHLSITLPDYITSLLNISQWVAITLEVKFKFSKMVFRSPFHLLSQRTLQSVPLAYELLAFSWGNHASCFRALEGAMFFARNTLPNLVCLANSYSSYQSHFKCHHRLQDCPDPPGWIRYSSHLSCGCTYDLFFQFYKFWGGDIG